MRAVLPALIAFGLVGSSVAAQDRKGIRFWNLTLYTITTLQMSPAGKDSWGADQCKNDRDGTVDHDERLRITGIEPGRYDVKFGDKIGQLTPGRATDRPPIFAHDLSCQPIDSGGRSKWIRLQAPPTPWQRGWRLHPSRPATGSRRVRDAAPSIESGRR